MPSRVSRLRPKGERALLCVTRHSYSGHKELLGAFHGLKYSVAQTADRGHQLEASKTHWKWLPVRLCNYSPLPLQDVPLAHVLLKEREGEAIIIDYRIKWISCANIKWIVLIECHGEKLHSSSETVTCRINANTCNISDSSGFSTLNNLYYLTIGLTKHNVCVSNSPHFWTPIFEKKKKLELYIFRGA